MGREGGGGGGLLNKRPQTQPGETRVLRVRYCPGCQTATEALVARGLWPLKCQFFYPPTHPLPPVPPPATLTPPSPFSPSRSLPPSLLTNIDYYNAPSALLSPRPHTRSSLRQHTKGNDGTGLPSHVATQASLDRLSRVGRTPRPTSQHAARARSACAPTPVSPCTSLPRCSCVGQGFPYRRVRMSGRS